MYTYKKQIIVAAITLSSQLMFSQFKTTIPLNKNVTSGKLENGLTYYILHNEEPKDRASFYFVQNVGAILEDDSQNGLAHFLEHMAFNGTEHFKGKGIIKMLEKNGVSFGKEINAFTATDETIYNISKVPVKNEKLIDSTLWVLHDWSGSLSLTDAEIDAERGVIREEWRTRRTSDFRLKKQNDQTLYEGSKYKNRDVIGDLNIINTFKYKEIKDYYKKWYRPDLQAVIIVGDIDPAAMEKKVKSIFSGIPLNKNRAERTYFDVPKHSGLTFNIATDKEANNTSISLRYIKDEPVVRDETVTFKNVLGSFYNSILNNRFKELTLKKESASLAIQSYFSSISRLNTSFNITAVAKKGKLSEAFTEAYTEAERFKRFGATKAELDRTKKDFISSYDDFIKNKDKVDNDTWADKLADYFLLAKPFLAVQDDYDLVVRTINKMTLEDLNAYAKTIQTPDNQVVLIKSPEPIEKELPKKEDVQAIMAKVEASTLEPYSKKENTSPMIDKELTPAPIRSTFAVPGISDAKGYVLANGAKVVVLPTAYSQDQILFSSFSKGGKSLVKTEDLISAEIAASLTRSSGLGNFDITALREKLTGKVAQAAPFIGTNMEGFDGSSNHQDFETLLQLTYLYFEKPRFDPNIFSLLKEKYQDRLSTIAKDNTKAFNDTVALANSNHNPRTILFNEKFVENMNFEKAESIYKGRIKNASDFTFVFVGNITEDQIGLIQKYIGNITSNESVKENFIDYNINPKKGKTTVHFNRAMEIPKTTAYVNLTGAAKYSQQDALEMYVIGELLSKRFLQTIREEEGGSYGVSVEGSLSKFPKPSFNLSLSFDCNPEKKERLMEIIWKELNQIKTNLPIASDLEDIKKAMLKKREESKITNSFWSSILSSIYMYDNPYNNDAEYAKLINNISAKSIQKLGTYIINNSNSVEVLMNPESKAGK
ncbi:insulinase family protein [Flavobacterium sp. MC2016-06]|uniref:M16 family metallopeptidase n=1 Tax=Flavobacterium sp. MC2016-06 TaxID=2676308 RepID=UPI0012BA8025|nr:M16 family metallopeptidase [Flavobacterium sp. MC2016-06]MBU3861695.1 insulinase family protein [Flavobacterium sp. MC2016-06]